MPLFRIFRLRDAASQQYRWAPHVSGASQAKRKDYDEDGAVEAANEYCAWQAMKETERPLRVGDLLESESGTLRICKYVGFEEAAWIVPEVKTGLESLPAAAGAPPPPAA